MLGVTEDVIGFYKVAEFRMKVAIITPFSIFSPLGVRDLPLPSSLFSFPPPLPSSLLLSLSSLLPASLWFSLLLSPPSSLPPSFLYFLLSSGSNNENSILKFCSLLGLNFFPSFLFLFITPFLSLPLLLSD